MVNRTTGISDEVAILDSTGTDITDELGWVMGLGWNIDHQTKVYPGIGGGSKYQDILDDMAITTFTFTLHPIDLKFFKLFGDYAEATGWTITLSDTLPEFTIQGNIDDSTMMELTGAKCGHATIRMNRGSPVEVAVEGHALKAQDKTGTITTRLPTVSRLFYLDGYVKIGSDVIGSADSITMELNRSTEPHRGIEQVAAGSIRLPSEIIEKLHDLSFTIVVEITDQVPFNHLFGEATLPLDIQDARDTVSLQLIFSDTEGTLTFTSGQISAGNMEKNADGEVRTVELRGLALDATIAGSLS